MHCLLLVKSDSHRSHLLRVVEAYHYLDTDQQKQDAQDAVPVELFELRQL